MECKIVIMIKSLILKVIKWLLGLKGLMSVLAIIVAVLADSILKPDTCEERINCYVGVIGLFYCLYWVIIWFLCPIKRDLMLMKGSAFIWRVIIFVILLPFAFTLCILCVEKKHEFHAHELVYASELSECETIKIPKCISDFRSNVEIISSSKKDTLLLHSYEMALVDSLYKNREKELISHPAFWSKLLNEDVLKVDIFTKNNADTIQIHYRKGLAADSISEQRGPSLLWTVYYHFVDPGNQHMTTTDKGRILALIIALLGVVLMNGLLVSTIINWIDRRKELWQKGGVRYNLSLKFIPHYIIIGGNDMVPGIVQQLLVEGMDDGSNSDKNVKKLIRRIKYFIQKPYIIIQTSRDVESFRRELYSVIKDDEQERIIIYYGHRTSKEDIFELQLNSVIQVYLLGEETRTDDMESYHDTMNMRCLELLLECYKTKVSKASDIPQLLDEIKTLKKNIKEASEENKKELEKQKEEKVKVHKSKLLQCRVMFEYQTTFSVFQFYDLDSGTADYIDFKPFNYYESWAQKVFINRELDKTKILSSEYLPLEGTDGIKVDSDNYVHLFVVGMSRMGVAMGIEAAHLAHYPNYNEEKKIRTKITFIDKNSNEEKDFFVGRFKELFALSHWRIGSLDEKDKLVWNTTHIPKGFDHLGGDFLDVEWEFIHGGIESMAIQDYILSSATPMAKVTIAICLPESNRSHAAALYLSKKIYESDSVLQVLVYNRYGKSIIESLHSKEAKYPYLNKLKSFGMPQDCLSTTFLKQGEDISAAVGNKYDEINKKYIEPARAKVNQTDGPDGYKGKSKVAKSWSNIYCGNTLWTKLRSVGSMDGTIDKKSIGVLADVEHNRWNIEQLLMNFRPLTKEEQEAVINKNKDKEDLKGKMAHLNICSNKRLLELENIDVAARAYDVGLTELLPDIYEIINKKNNDR